MTALRRFACRLLAALALACAAFAASAQGYPTKPVHFIVPYAPGGPLDAVARALAEKVREPLGQAVIVENKPGAGGNIGADFVAKSAPDGYAIVMGAVATHAINPALFPRMPYDPVKDFAPITLVASVPNVLVMNAETAAKLNIRSVQDLVAYAKAHPGQLNFASGGNGSAGHLAGELLKSMAHVYAVHIPYAGAAPAQLALVSGQTEFMFDNLASAAPQIRNGKLKALAVTTAQRAAAFPELPTVAESGLPGFDINTWFGIFAPAHTPAPVVRKLNEVFTAALRSPEIKERLARMGAEPAPTTPEQLGALVQRELKKYAQVVKASGAKLE